MRRILIAVGVVVALLLVGYGGYRLVARRPAPPPPPPPTPTPTPTPTPSWATGLTPDTADPALREAAADLSDDPLWATWLAQSDLVRRFVASVNLIAHGKSPRSQLGFLRPRGRFRVRRRGGALYADPASFRRYDPVVRVLASIDPARAAALYREATPVIQAAWAEIGPPGVPFDRVLLQAIDHLLATPVPDGPVRLEEKTVVTYRYADPHLESLSDAQRHLLRLGPDNVRRVQEWLRAFREALEGSRTGPEPTPVSAAGSPAGAGR